ncbi:uncharacterized protein A1O5_04660 [Cladophialophora psammophila CBS 110553]|uniref:Enoyl reductase (ER) domain-containing protein n=1 Tax=Cladophialophora psammophila CBS 110553 TaxID=1182543 RepID=W9X5F3_9EURO|nr:uncharacterized protein A1O5_04660 [Cladophialophora psammophila CBS 110553]EXJ72156.1 hypothetical protein A1O5_04660 [Cladophialophora psammophila CBS 110553]
MVLNKAMVFRQIPEGLPVAGNDLTIEPVTDYDGSSPAPAGGVLLQAEYASFDPYMKGRMRPAHIKSNATAFELNKPLVNQCIARVIRSSHPRYQPGDQVIGELPIQQYISLSGVELDKIQHLENPLGLEDIRVFLGALGMSGLTAYSSFYEIRQPKKRETIFISAASGSVGSMVGQLAKREGLKVIGSVGSDDKLDFIINELGFDAGFNYKKERPSDALKRLAPDGIDIDYENVGGDNLEAALDAMREHGRVIICGLISDYSAAPGQRYPLYNYSVILRRRLTVRGFVVFDHGFVYHAKHQANVQRWIKDGTLKVVTWECEGIDNAIDGLLALFSGRNFGKAVLKF